MNPTQNHCQPIIPHVLVVGDRVVHKKIPTESGEVIRLANGKAYIKWEPEGKPVAYRVDNLAIAPPVSAFNVGDRVTFIQHWYGEPHQFEGIVQSLNKHPMTAVVRYETPEHLQDGINRPNIIQSPIALFSLSKPPMTADEAKQDLNSVPFGPVKSFGGQDQEDGNSPTPVFGQFWIEERYKIIKGKRYGPYKLKRWRDENGKKRSQSLGKTQTVTPQ